MGFFKTLREVNDATHGKRITRQFHETMQYIDSFDESARRLVLNKFVSLISIIQKQNISSGLALAKKMQSDARAASKVNSGESCALWLAAAWLESLWRDSEEAKSANEALNDLALSLRRQNFENGEPPSLWEFAHDGKSGMPQYDLGAQYYLEKIGGSLVAYYEKVPYVTGKESYDIYNYVAKIWPDSGAKRFYVARATDENGTQFDHYLGSDGKIVCPPTQVNRHCAHKEGFVISVVNLVSFVIEKQE